MRFVERPNVGCDAVDCLVGDGKKCRAVEWASVIVEDAECPSLFVAGREFVAERGGLDHRIHFARRSDESELLEG